MSKRVIGGTLYQPLILYVSYQPLYKYNFKFSEISQFFSPSHQIKYMYTCTQQDFTAVQSVYLIPPPQKFVITGTHNDKNVRSSPASVPDAGSSSPAWHTSSCT